MNVLDYIIIITIILYGIWGFSKGLGKTLLSLGSTFVAFISVKILYPLVMQGLISMGVSDYVYTRILSTFSRIVPNLPDQFQTLIFPSSIIDLTNQAPYFQDILEKYPNLMNLIESNINQLAGTSVLQTFISYVLGTFTIVIIFFVVKSILLVVTSALYLRLDKENQEFYHRISGFFIGIIMSIIMLCFVLQTLEVYALISTPVLEETISESKYGHIFTEIPLLKTLDNNF